MQLKESVLDLKDLNDVTSWSEAKQKDFQLCRRTALAYFAV